MRELNAKKDVVVDGTFHKHIRREQMKKMAAENSEPIFFIEVKDDEKTVKKRLKKTRKNSEADFDVYKNLEQEFEKEEKGHLELWSNEDKVGEMVNKAKQYIYE
jgi:predicted kinase